MEIDYQIYKRLGDVIDKITQGIIDFLTETNNMLSKYKYEPYVVFAKAQKEEIKKVYRQLSEQFAEVESEVRADSRYMTGSDDEELHSQLSQLEKRIEEINTSIDTIPDINTDTYDPFFSREEIIRIRQERQEAFKKTGLNNYTIQNTIREEFDCNEKYDIGEPVIEFQKVMIRSLCDLIKGMDGALETLGEHIEESEKKTKTKAEEFRASLETAKKPTIIKIDLKNQSACEPDHNGEKSDATLPVKPKVKSSTIKLNYQVKHKEVQDEEATIDEIIKCCSIDRDEAKNIFDTIQTFVRGDIGYLKRSAVYHNTNEATSDDITAIGRIDFYLNHAKIWIGGAIYRGINLDKKVVDSIVNGTRKTFDMEGPSSWSSDKEVAERFAIKNSGGMVPVVFELKNNKSASSISHFLFGDAESEVLAPSGVQYDIDKVETIEGVVHVHVHEHEHKKG